VVGPDWCCRYANAPAGELLRRPRERLLGVSIRDEIAEQDRPRFLAAFEQAVREGRPVQVSGHAGVLNRWFEARAFPQGEDLVIFFRDVTDDRLVEERLRDYRLRLSEAEQIAHFGMWRWDIGAGEVHWSDELHRIYGLEPGAFPGTVEAFVSYLHPDDRERIWGNIENALHTLEPFAVEERIVRADGEERLLYSHGRAVAGSDGRPVALVGVCHDVTEQARTERALGVSEGRMRAILDHTPSIIVVKDLDGCYQLVNRECANVLGVGPEEIVGRQCEEVFPEISAQMRANDRKAVASGEPVYDEAILAPDGEPRTYLTATFPLPGRTGRFIETCTIGTDVTERKERESARRERVGWTERIESALRDERMLVYAQPVIETASGEREGYELLVRMRDRYDPDVILQPGSFLPAAERYGLIKAIDVWMVRQALTLASGIAPRVNLSAVTLCDVAARDEILALLRAAPTAARRLVFEITETASAEHLDAAIQFAGQLVEVGCGLALDDFGTGFGSFTYLRQLPLRYLKIDRSFVIGLTGSADDRRVVQSIIGIAEQFTLRTIAEGVEDEPTLQLLDELGTHYAQGFHVGRPAPLRAPAAT
jgi:PAS domain S-box-containing protein